MKLFHCTSLFFTVTLWYTVNSGRVNDQSWAPPLRLYSFLSMQKQLNTPYQFDMSTDIRFLCSTAVECDWTGLQYAITKETSLASKNEQYFSNPDSRCYPSMIYTVREWHSMALFIFHCMPFYTLMVVVMINPLIRDIEQHMWEQTLPDGMHEIDINMKNGFGLYFSLRDELDI